MRGWPVLVKEEYGGHIVYDIWSGRTWILKGEDTYKILAQSPETDADFVLKFIEQETGIRRSKFKAVSLTDLGLSKNSLSDADDLALPYTIEFYPTLKCNARCLFCYQSSNLLYDVAQADLSTAKVLLNQISEFGIPQLYIGGGEPLVWNNFNEFISESREVPVAIDIATNATLYKSRLNALMQENVRSVFISIHGNEEIHNKIIGVDNAYSSALGLAGELMNSGKPVVVNYVCVPGLNDSRELVVEACRAIQETGAKKVRFLTVLEYGSAIYYGHKNLKISTVEEAVKWRNLMRQVLEDNGITLSTEFFIPFAFALDGVTVTPDVDPILKHFYGVNQEGICKIAVMHNGDVYPSELWATYDKFRGGNITDQRLPEIYHSPEFREYRSKFRTPPLECRRCKYVSVCSGGEPLLRYKHFGKYFYQVKDPRCPLDTAIKPQLF